MADEVAELQRYLEQNGLTLSDELRDSIEGLSETAATVPPVVTDLAQAQVH